MSSVDDFLQSALGGRFEAASFETIGKGVAGTIVGTPKVAETQYGTRLVVDLMQADGSGVTVWIREGLMAAAVGQAAKDATGTTSLAEGGKLAIVLTGERDTGKGNPAKEYQARYEPPAGAVDVGSIFDGLS